MIGIVTTNLRRDGRGTMAADVRLDPSYRRELVRRVDRLVARGVTLVQIAEAAGLSRQSLFRLLRDKQRTPTTEQADRTRQAVMALDPEGPPIPPPVTITPTRGPSHSSWQAALRADRAERRR